MVNISGGKQLPLLRHTRVGLIVLLTFCLIFFVREYQVLTEKSESFLGSRSLGKAAMRHQFDYNENHIEESVFLSNPGILSFILHLDYTALFFSKDEILLLKAQLGYLKKKLANLGHPDNFHDPSQPTIYVITPTHTRPGQLFKIDCCQTFLHYYFGR